MCLQLAVENCYQPNRNNNMTVIELTNHQNLETFTSLLKTVLSNYPQVKVVLPAALTVLICVSIIWLPVYENNVLKIIVF
jgi:hypothetical protein